MTALNVPETGLSLCRDHPGADATTKPTHVMRLNLAQDTINDLVQSLRDSRPARVRFGKHQTLYYGSKSQQFHSAPESHRSEIYSSGSTDKENLYFTGVLSHRLEVQKAQEATSATDQALANLEQSLNAYEKGKESKKTHMVDDINEVKALRSGTGKPLARTPVSKVEREKDRLLQTTANRSVSSSPGADRSPASVPSLTSAPVVQNKDRIRLDALKIPFVHLLAIRAVSVKFLARQTRASLEDCSTLAQKYGVESRLDREKFNLKDKAYRELDVWNFPYPSQEDRQEAIENAISAFDRMRISRADKQWQTLLPKEERGKGKCLSRLHLSTGPMKKPATARVQVQNPDDSAKDGDLTDREIDKASNDGKAADSTAAAAKSGAAAQKKRAPWEKASTKGKNTTNSTLTGRVTKKAERKPAAKPDSKIKSAEYVHESDEEDMDMPDAPPAPEKRPEKASEKASEKAREKAPRKGLEKGPEEPSQKAGERPQLEKTDTTEKQQNRPATKRVGPSAPSTVSSAPKSHKPERPPPKPEPSTAKPATKSTALKKPPTSHANNSTSPRKPSPLGASPPANASEVHTHSRSSSYGQFSSISSFSPLISQASRPKQQPTSTTPGATKAARANGALNFQTANPLKRKAEPDRLSVSQSHTSSRVNGNLEHKRRRAVSTSSGGSTGSSSPPLTYELLRQQLREKSQKFKQQYAKYRALHNAMATHPDPPRADLDRLHQQHVRLQRMKKEIWDEDRRLREGL